MTDFAAQVDAWLEPLGDPPCGPDLEYDNSFLELIKAAEGKPETQFGPASPPDWRQVMSLSTELLEKTRDVRIAFLVARAWLHDDGLMTLPHSLRLVREWMERYWDQVHPQPDPDDGDAYARINIIAQLEDTSTFLGDVRQAVVFRSRAVGQLLVRDIEVSLDKYPPRDDEHPLPQSVVEQMMADAMLEMPELGTLAERSLHELNALLALIDDKAGYGRGPSCDVLKDQLNGLRKLTPSEGGAAADDVDLDSLLNSLGDGDHDASADTPRARSGGNKGGMGAIESRADAIKAIDLVCKYLEAAEPSNPAQLLLRRAQALIDKSFLELVKELAPESLNEVAKIMGVNPDQVGGSDF
jgi:type VI secretion system protein ImpA